MRVLLVAEGKHELDGALEALVKRIVPTDPVCTTDFVSCNEIHAHHGKGQGYFKKAVRWLLTAEDRDYDALVLLIDQDGHPERDKEIAEAQQSKLGVSRRALGVAIRMFDAWILADETALSEALERKIERQPNPEKLKNPKEDCKRLLEGSEVSMSPAELYRSVCRIAKIHVLRERCPRGFGPFAERLQSLE
ncbi:MAG: DUF4276 family protein [Planctomycetes bacterium]|nr:DUF4276 family protein [Planctomycetota bacterium]